MRSVLVYEKSAGEPVEDVVRAVKRAWPELSLIPLAVEDADTLDGQRVVVLPGYDIAITLGVNATHRCVADWQATQICYVMDAPRHSPRSRPRFHDVALSRGIPDPSPMPTAVGEQNQIRLVREHEEPPIRWDRFDPMTFHIAASPEIWNSLPARSIRRVSQIVPPPIDTDFFQPSDVARDEEYFCVFEECGAGTSTIVEACRHAGRRLVVSTYGTSASVPAHVAEQPHVQIRELGGAEDLREQLRHRRALIATRSGWSSLVLEAQACGMPVILAPGHPSADDRSPVRLEESLLIDMEETEPGSGLCCDEHTAGSICSAIRELERRPQRFSPSLAWAHAARHSPHCFGRNFKHLAEQARKDDIESSSFARQHWKRAG